MKLFDLHFSDRKTDRFVQNLNFPEAIRPLLVGYLFIFVQQLSSNTDIHSTEHHMPNQPNVYLTFEVFNLLVKKSNKIK